MANPEHLAILKQGVEVWNKWRDGNQAIQPDLVSAALNNLDLQGVNFESANLVGVGLRKSNLRYASLSGADISQAALTSANLDEASLFAAKLRWSALDHSSFVGSFLAAADLSNANLSYANLNGANLIESIISDSNVHKTNFTKALFGNTILSALDMSQAIGLDSAIHQSPSTVGIDTIFLSLGKIPESFQRKAGVPKDFIDCLQSLLRVNSVHFYSCFISYSTKDKRFCDSLYADLMAKGVRVWKFDEDAKMGRPLWGEIDKNIKRYDKLVVVCSERSLQSVPVNREIERALQREDREGKHVLFPIRLDDYIFEKWEHERKADVTKMVIGDFTNWKDPVAYKKAFDKLLAALQAEDKKTKKKA